MATKMPAKIMAKKFESSKKDVERKNVKEGSKKDMMIDKMQKKSAPMKKGK